MPILNIIRADFEQHRPFAGLRVAICLHLEAKTAYLAEVIQAGGAEVAICGSNPLSTQDDVCAGLASLTPQQFRVLTMVCDGLLNKQIAYDLNVSEATVKAHVTAIFRKLNVRTRTQAALLLQQMESIPQNE